MTSPRRAEGGFTMIELMIAMVIMIVGGLGVMAMQAANTKAARLSREIDNARELSVQMIEDVRAKDPTTLSTSTLTSVVGTDGTTYLRTYTVTTNTFSPTMRVVVATVGFYEDGDTGDYHQVDMEILRTTQELF